MSNLETGYFNDPNTPYGMKLGSLAMLLRATSNFNLKRGANNNVITFEGLVPTKNASGNYLQGIYFDFGVNDSAGNNNCRSAANTLANESFDAVGIVEGKYADSQVISMVISECKTKYNVNQEGLKAISALVSKNLSEYNNVWFNCDPTTFNRVVKENAENLVQQYLDAVNNSAKKEADDSDKKKQIAAQM